MKCYGMLQNARVTAFTISELLRENQRGGRGKITPIPLQPDQEIISKCLLGAICLLSIVSFSIIAVDNGILGPFQTSMMDAFCKKIHTRCLTRS